MKWIRLMISADMFANVCLCIAQDADLDDGGGGRRCCYGALQENDRCSPGRVSNTESVKDLTAQSAALLEAPKPPVFLCEGADDVYEPRRLFWQSTSCFHVYVMQETMSMVVKSEGNRCKLVPASPLLWETEVENKLFQRAHRHEDGCWTSVKPQLPWVPGARIPFLTPTW